MKVSDELGKTGAQKYGRQIVNRGHDHDRVPDWRRFLWWGSRSIQQVPTLVSAVRRTPDCGGGTMPSKRQAVR